MMPLDDHNPPDRLIHNSWNARTRWAGMSTYDRLLWWLEGRLAFTLTPSAPEASIFFLTPEPHSMEAVEFIAGVLTDSADFSSLEWCVDDGVQVYPNDDVLDLTAHDALVRQQYDRRLYPDRFSPAAGLSIDC